MMPERDNQLSEDNQWRRDNNCNKNKALYCHG